MIQALHFKDEKADKFWFIETLDCELMVNYGKTGVTGKYEIKEFDTVKECEKEAQKLINSKKKKGYKEFPEFDRDNHYYFDDEEYGLSPLTSHPIFRKYFSNEIYYDCGDEEAPFGSDEGHDAFSELEESVRKKKKINFLDFPRVIIEEIWEMDYLTPDLEKTDEELKEQAKTKYNGLLGDQIILQSDQVILAVTFGQAKITGKIDKDLLELALKSLNRIDKLNRLIWNWEKEEATYYIETMRKDLIKYKEDFLN
ncbi:WGR domain-containing protein [Fusobacterium periodonticum]|uniref:WGR domain protein n=1 Tax=Fusobacterium periodonticum ATCC 33693 TaxID=546275 RepID=D4CWF4_9FUSO|nr:WGR domain-containing protein [Fusobacterium periodonticum]EFE86369.1 WGR domain protein [Fusobacterium periodonticum ATCC 33693]